MPKRETLKTSVVLDTSCFRGTSRASIRALQRLQFELYVSGQAVNEVAVHLAPKENGGTDDKQQANLRARLRWFSEVFNGEPRLAPTHAALVSKLGGRVTGIGDVPYAAWLDNMRAVWKGLAGLAPIAPEIATLISGLSSYVEETGADFIETSRAVASLGELTEEELKLGKQLRRHVGSALDYIWLPPPVSKADRFDAYTRLLDLHTTRAHERAVGRQSAHEPNHAIDLTLLHHLAEGFILVTRDYELVEEVDACGTVQAPWVRTVGELLAGRVPSGQPFSFNARRAKAKHRPRSRANLRRLDEEQGARARAEDSASSPSPAPAQVRPK